MEVKVKRTNPDELMHYGVLGMKWGRRNATKTGGTYKYASLSTKRWAKKSNKLNLKADELDSMGDTSKASKVRAKAVKAKKISDRSADHDSKMEALSRKAKTGNVVVSNLLGGLWAHKTYASIQASGGSKATGVVASVVNSMLGTGPIGAAVVKSAYIHDVD